MSEIVQSRPGRTYPLPRAVVEEARQGLQWMNAYSMDRQIIEHAKWMGAFLASGGSVTADVVGILASIASSGPADRHWSKPTDADYPNWARVESALMGGKQFLRWTDKIMASLQREHETALAASLELIGYDEGDTYIGICDANDDTIVRSLVKVGENSLDWKRWSGDKWEDVDHSDIRRYDALELDRELTAFAASAFSEGNSGFMLMFAEPVAWLPYEPIVAALEADDVEGAHYYAVVDATDNTAVMDLISISPGPHVRVRNAGQWEDSDKTLDLLRSVSPPPLVELDESQLQMVMAQIDGTYDAAETNEDYVESLGHEDEIVEKKQEEEAAKAAEFERRRNAAPIAASLESSLRSVNSGDYGSHGSVVASALKTRQELQTRLLALETVVNAPLVSAAEGGLDRNRGNAESLRRYWLYGKGALKIKWGTSGDWSRCYRYLSKYLGTRAKGYCNLRHKQATGMYAGDKRNK